MTGGDRQPCCLPGSGTNCARATAPPFRGVASPLLEYHEGQGLVMFCQMDVTGRTDSEPAADTLVRNLLRYLAEWKPAPRRKAIYVGDPQGKERLQAAGLTLANDEGRPLSAEE